MNRPLITAFLLASLALPVHAITIEGVEFADSYERDGVTLRVRCVGLLRYMIVIKGYVAALYLDPTAAAEQALGDVAKRLELNYFYAIKGSDFGKAADKLLADNLDAARLVQLQPRIAQLHALYEDVRPGDRYALTYIPQQGTELALNGVRKGLIEGADFAAAYFSIWLGEHPLDVPLREQLLRCS